MELGPWWMDAGPWGLFLASFLAATVLPFSSEAVLAAMALGPWSTLVLWAAASTGNTLGGMTSYGLGSLGSGGRMARWLGVDAAKAARWERLVVRHGVWAALLTWLPVVGDVIAVALGIGRARPWAVLVLMFVGKAARYGVVLILLR